VIRRLAFLRSRRARVLTVLPIAILAMLEPSPAFAYEYSVTGESDWLFTVEDDAALVVIYGNSNRSCSEPGADPYLWLYDSSDVLVAQNDDGNHSEEQCVSSKIYVTLSAGDYRLRAGYYPQQQGLNYDGPDYVLLTDFLFTNASPSTTTSSSSTTLPTAENGPSPTTTTPTSTTTSTVPQTIGPPTNLALTVDYFNGTVTADWDAPTSGTLDPERYAIGFGLNDDGNAGPYGVATGNVGDENALNTAYTFDASYIETLFNEAHGLFNVAIRSDNDTEARYSSWTPVQSTTIMNMPDVVDNQTYVVDTATGDLTFSWDASSDGFVDPSHYQIAWNDTGNMRELEDEGAISSTGNFSQTSYTVAYEDIGSGVRYFNILACGSEGDCHIGETMEIEVSAPPPPTTTTTSTTTTTTTTTTSTTTTTTTLPPTTTTSTTSTTTIPPTTTSTTTTTEVPPSTSTSTTTTTTTSTVPTTSSSSTTTTTSTTLPPVVTVVDTTPAVTTTTVAPAPTTVPTSTTTTIVATTTSTTEAPVERVTTTTAEPSTTTTVPQPKTESEIIEEKAAQVVESIDDEELAETVFEVITAEEVSVEEIAQLTQSESFDDLPQDVINAVVDAINDESDDVKEAFEDNVDVFAGAFDEYVPSGSVITVAERRVVVAVAATAAIAAAPAPGASSGGGSSASGGSSRSKNR